MRRLWKAQAKGMPIFRLCNGDKALKLLAKKLGE